MIGKLLEKHHCAIILRKLFSLINVVHADDVDVDLFSCLDYRLTTPWYKLLKFVFNYFSGLCKAVPIHFVISFNKSR